MRFFEYRYMVVNKTVSLRYASLVPRPPPFLPSICVHNNTRKQKNQGRPGNDATPMSLPYFISQLRQGTKLLVKRYSWGGEGGTCVVLVN